MTCAEILELLNPTPPPSQERRVRNREGEEAQCRYILPGIDPDECLCCKFVEHHVGSHETFYGSAENPERWELEDERSVYTELERLRKVGNWVNNLLSVEIDADVKVFCDNSGFKDAPISVGDNVISLQDAKSLVVHLLHVIEEAEKR